MATAIARWKEMVTPITGDIEDASNDLVNGFSRYKKDRHSVPGGGEIDDLIRVVIHFINRWYRTKNQFSDLKQKQQELSNKSQDLLPPPPTPSRRLCLERRQRSGSPATAV